MWNAQRSRSQRWGRRLVMAETKKTVSVKPAAKAAAKAADTKTAQAATTTTASVATTEPAVEPKKEETKKAAAAKKTTTRKTTAKKTTAKKETAKKTTAVKKPAVKETVHVQFADKSYTAEDFVKIAKDVWKYDLHQKVGDFKSVELYVKPEESVVYYVINGEVQGNFGI